MARKYVYLAAEHLAPWTDLLPNRMFLARIRHKDRSRRKNGLRA